MGREFREAVVLGRHLPGQRVAPTQSHVGGEFQTERRKSRSKGLALESRGHTRKGRSRPWAGAEDRY